MASADQGLHKGDADGDRGGLNHDRKGERAEAYEQDLHRTPPLRPRLGSVARVVGGEAGILFQDLDFVADVTRIPCHGRLPYAAADDGRASADPLHRHVTPEAS